MHRLRNRSGFAIPAAILVIGVLSISLAAGFSLVIAERRGVDDQKAQVSAFVLAEQGLQMFFVRRDSLGFRSTPPATREGPVRIMMTGGYADVELDMIKPAQGSLAGLYVVRSKGTQTRGAIGGTPAGVGAAPAGGAAGSGTGIRMPDLAARAFSNPDPTSVPGGSNSPEVLRAGWPASGLLASAGGLAGLYRDLLAGRLLDPAALRRALLPRATGPDRILGVSSAFGLGFMLPSQTLWVPPAGRGSAFGHAGLSGAVGLGDTSRRLAIGYVTNLIGAETPAARAARLISAAYLSTD